MLQCPSCFRERADGSVCAECATRSRSELALPLGAALRNERYHVGRTLGDPGGFGVTYLGWDASLHRRVAIKEYFPRQLATRAASEGAMQPLTITAEKDFTTGLQGFLDEARRLAQLDHANIVKVHDYCEANGTGYLVMSYYEGRDLADYTKSRGGRLPWQEALSLALPLLDGLADVHRAGFIHRDIKPANIYLATTADGATRPILIDFGAARWAATSHELTSILTEGYAPLEQYPGCGAQGSYTDLYATAATLYALIAGVIPASAPARLAGEYVAHLTDLVPGVPRRLGDAIEVALSVQAEERPQMASEFARMLRAANPTGSSRAVSTGSTRVVPPSPPPARIDAMTTPMGPEGWTTAVVPERAPPESVRSTRPADPPEEPEPPRARRERAEPRAPRSMRGPLIVLGLVLAAVVGWRAWSMVELAATNAALTALSSAEGALRNAQYGDAMRSLARARKLFADPRVTDDARMRGATEVDSLARVVERTCKSASAIAVSRGESVTSCPSRPW